MGDRKAGFTQAGETSLEREYRAALDAFAAERGWGADDMGRPVKEVQGDMVVLDVVCAPNPRTGRDELGFATFRASGADEGRECVRLDIKEAVAAMVLRIRAERAAGVMFETAQEAEATSSFGMR